jgi:hypothetical protein
MCLYNLGDRYRLVEPEDRLWGSTDANGTWSGLVGQALYRRARRYFFSLFIYVFGA